MSDNPQYKRILVIRLGALGDVILLLGTMAALRRQHPDAHITFLTTQPFAGFMQKSPYFNHVWSIERWPAWRIDEWVRFAKTLRTENFDCVYDLQRNDRTAIFRRLAPKHLQKNWFGKNPSPAGALAITDIRKFPLPDLSWANADISRFNLRPPFVLLVPGSSPQHPEKRWPVAHYAALALKLEQQGYTPVALGTAAEDDIIRQLIKAAPATVGLAGQTSFMDIAALAREAAGAIGNDTGPMHLIALTGCPSVSLFSGATDPAQSAPLGKNVKVLRAPDLADLGVSTVMTAFLELQ